MYFREEGETKRQNNKGLKGQSQAKTSVLVCHKPLKIQDGGTAVNWHWSLQLPEPLGGCFSGHNWKKLLPSFWSLTRFILLKVAEHPKKLLFLYTVPLDIYYTKNNKKCWSLKTLQVDFPSAMRLRSSLQVSCSFGKIPPCNHEGLGIGKGQWCVSTVVMGMTLWHS